MREINFTGGADMKTKTAINDTILEKVTLVLPKEIVDDLNKIASFNETSREDLVYSYIVDGIAGDSRTVKRMNFTDHVNETLGKNNIPPKTVEDIFNNLVY